MAKREEAREAGTIALLARAILATGTESASPAALRQAQLLMLDTIGCGFAGICEEAARAVVSASRFGSTRDCAIIGRAGRGDVLNAVLVNGVFIRVLDLNDYLIGDAEGEPETAGHPSDNVPVALAMGSARTRSGRDILDAIVVGYELYARLQRAMDRGGQWDGVTASGLVAPAMAGILMGLDEERLAHALALSLSRAPTPSIVRGGDISATKSLANALVAQSGVHAALLAEQGVTGPLAILDDGKRGLQDLFPRTDMSALTAPFPSDGAIMRAHVKTYPCINTGQSAVAAALELHAMLKDRAMTLSRIELIMADYKVTKRHQEDESRAHPKSREAADHSFPFIVAVALIDGRFGIDQFDGRRWEDENVRALMVKIVMRRDSEWNRRAPGSYPCAIRAVDENGQEYSVEVPYPPGFSRGGLDSYAVIEKFHTVTEPFLSRDERARIVDGVMEFDVSPSAEKLNEAIAIEGTTRERRHPR